MAKGHPGERGLRVAQRVVGMLFALALGLPQVAAAQAGPADAGLAPVTAQAGELEVTVGEPIELVAIKTRTGEIVAGDALVWSLEDEADGKLEALDAATRPAGEGVEAGSGRASFTPARAGQIGIRVQSAVEPGCTAADCRQVAYRFRLLARVSDAAEGDAARSQQTLLRVAGGVAGAAALAALLDDGGDGKGAGTLAILSGNGQGGLANRPLPLPLVVLALDGGDPAQGVAIQWAASGGATLSAASGTTGADGRASVTVTSLGAGPGPVTVTATRADVAGASVPFTLAVNIAGLDKVSGDNQSIPVDTTTPAPLVVRTLLNGAPQAGVAVTWQVASGMGTLSGVSAVSDANGLAQAFVDAGPLPGAVTVRASRVDSPQLAQVFTVDVVELRDLVVASGNGQVGAQDAGLPAPLVVQATDGGVGDAGVTVFWSATGGATLSANSTVTDGAGFTDVTVTNLGVGLEPVVVTAQRADQPALTAEFSFNITPATLAVVSGDGQSGLAGRAASAPVEVQLLNGNGQPMAGQNIAWQVTAGDAMLQSPMSVTNGSGVASVTFVYGTQPGPVTIEASAFSGEISASAGATGLSAAGLAVISGDGQSGDPGEVLPQLLVVRIVDSNPDLSGIPVTFSVVSGSATLSVLQALTDANGDASTEVTLGLTPGPVVVEAAAPGGVVAQFNLMVDGTLVVTGISASAGDAQTLTPGVASAPMVVELIGNGVPVVGQTVQWSTTGGTLANATTVTDANGRSSNTVTVSGAGSTVVTASFPSYAEFVGSSITFTHNAGLAALPNLAVNEASVAEALDAACGALQGSGTPTPGEQDLLAQCQALADASTSDPDAVGDALTAMLPDVAQTQADAGKAAVGAQFENLNTRIGTLRSGTPMAQLSFSGLSLAMSGGRLPLAQLGSVLLDADPVPDDTTLASKWGFFLSGNIGRSEFDPTGLTPRYDLDVEGVTGGVDYRWSDSLVLGLALGYTQQDTQLAGDQGSVDTRGVSLSAYTTWYQANDWYLDGVLTLSRNNYDHARRIRYVLPGSVVDQTATAESDGDDVSSTLTFGRDFQVKGWSLGVYGRAAYNRLGFDAFEEEVDVTLAGSGLALRVDSRTVSGLSSTLGGRASYAHSASWGVLLPQLEVEWVHDYRSDAEAFRGFFVDDPTGTPILVLGDDLDSDYFRIGLGLSMVLTHGRSGFITYDRVVARSGIAQQTLSLGFRWEF